MTTTQRPKLTPTLDVIESVWTRGRGMVVARFDAVAA